MYQLLEETLDAGGHPLTTFPNALRDIVLPPSLLTKFLSSVGGASLASGPATAGPFSSPIPWRKSGVRHTNNEIYFDVVEELKAIVNKCASMLHSFVPVLIVYFARHGTTVSSNVWGRIETNAKLSGTPDCLLSLNRPSILTDCAFHPCVRLQRWVRDKALSFVPPDGKFTLVEYRLASASEPSAQLPARDVYPLPFTVKSSISIEESTCTPIFHSFIFHPLTYPSGSFQINLTSRLPSHAIENLIAEMYLGAGVVGLNCTTNRGTSGGGFSNTSGKSSGASAASSWVFDSRKSTLRWEIPLVAPSSSWSISGSFRSTPSTKPTTPRPSHAIQFRFEIPGHTYSAMKVEQLKVTQSGMGGVSDTGKGGPQKPYKGVRGRSVGDIEWRW